MIEPQKLKLILIALFMAFWMKMLFGIPGLPMVALGLVLSTLWSGVSWLQSLKAARATEDLPTARTRSAAQGYVELVGLTRPLESGLLKSPGGSDCVWWSRRLTAKQDGKTVIQHTTSSQPFYLEDPTGRCLVDPAGAELTASFTRAWTDATYAHSSESFLPPGVRLYVLGELRSTRKSPHALDRMRTKLQGWLADGRRRALLDVSGDGRLDERELEAARGAAMLEARREIGTELTQADVVRKPSDGRPFIISTTVGQRRAQETRSMATASLLWFVASATLLASVLALLVNRS